MTFLERTFTFTYQIINRVITLILPWLPRWMAKPFASPYVAGETIQEALQHVRVLNARGFSATMDILGEHVQTTEEAENITSAYCDLLTKIHAEKLDSTISIKPTHLGLELDKELTEKNILKISKTAKSLKKVVTIDMENSPYTDDTLRIYKTCISEYSDVGTVLQAYLFRSLDDLQSIDSTDLHLRICKGIYRESPEIAYQDKEDIRSNFTQMTKTLLRGKGFAAIATHDIKLIDALDEWITRNNIPKDRFEFQVLYGVPMGDRLECLKSKGYQVRVYVPFGKSWFDYSIRRLKENPNVLWYILGNIIKRASKQSSI